MNENLTKNVRLLLGAAPAKRSDTPIASTYEQMAKIFLPVRQTAEFFKIVEHAGLAKMATQFFNTAIRPHN